MVSLISKVLEAVVARVLAIRGAIANGGRGGFNFRPAIKRFGDEPGPAWRAVVKNDFLAAGQFGAPVEEAPRDTEIGSVEFKTPTRAFVERMGDGFD